MINKYKTIYRTQNEDDLSTSIEIDWFDSHTTEPRELDVEVDDFDTLKVHAHSIVFTGSEVFSLGFWQLYNSLSGWYNVLTYTSDSEFIPFNPCRKNLVRLKVIGNLGSVLYSNTLEATLIRSSELGCCPTLDMKLNISKNEYKIVSELEINDLVFTKHELTKEFGLFPIKRLQKIKQLTYKFTLDNGQIVKVSKSHKFETIDGDYKEALYFTKGDFLIMNEGEHVIIKNIEDIGLQEVMKIEVEDAHTYMIQDIHSHNKNLPSGEIY